MEIKLGKWTIGIEKSGLIIIGVIMAIFIVIGFVVHFSMGVNWVETGILELMLFNLLIMKGSQARQIRKDEQREQKEEDERMKKLIRQVINERH